MCVLWCESVCLGVGVSGRLAAVQVWVGVCVCVLWCGVCLSVWLAVGVSVWEAGCSAGVGGVYVCVVLWCVCLSRRVAAGPAGVERAGLRAADPHPLPW